MMESKEESMMGSKEESIMGSKEEEAPETEKMGSKEEWMIGSKEAETEKMGSKEGSIIGSKEEEAPETEKMGSKEESMIGSKEEGEEAPETEKRQGKEERKRMVGWLSNKIQRHELKPGDHIYSWRHNYLYSHHGIYVGDEKVVHFTRSADHEIGTGTVLDRFIFSSSPSNPSDTPCPRCGDQSKANGVISSCLECFLYGGELYLFEYGVSPMVFLAKFRGGTCTLATSDPPEHVIHRAEFLLQNGFGGYDVFKNNCEDFAIYCKTGLLVFTSVSVGRSGQATSFVAAATVIVSSPLRFMTNSFPGLAAVGCGIYCISRFVTDIGIRRDVTKIPVERLVARSGLDESATTSSEMTKEE